MGGLPGYDVMTSDDPIAWAGWVSRAAPAPVRRDLETIPDTELHQSLATVAVAPGKPVDPFATLPPPAPMVTRS